MKKDMLKISKSSFSSMEKDLEELILKILKNKELQNIFNPFCELYHYESLSRGLDTDSENQERFLAEVERFSKKWSAKLEKGDPYYNPNFSLDISYELK